MSSDAAFVMIGVKVRRSAGAGDRPFVTLARDREGTWDPSDSSAANDGPSFIIRRDKCWEPMVSAVVYACVSACVDICTQENIGQHASFIDCYAHIGWFGALAAEAGASKIVLVESNETYRRISTKNMEFAAFAGDLAFSDTTWAAVESTDHRSLLTIRLRGVHFDRSMLTFMTIASIEQLSALIVDLYAADAMLENIVEFVVASLSVFSVFHLGCPESSIVPASPAAVMRPIDDGNARRALADAAGGSGVVLLFVRKGPHTAAIMSSVVSVVRSLYVRTHEY